MVTPLRRVLARASLALVLGAAVLTHSGAARADGGYGQGGVSPTTSRGGAGGSAARPEREIAYSDFIVLVNGDKVREVVLAGQTVSGALTDASRFRTFAPQDPGLISRLVDHRVRVTVTPRAGGGLLPAAFGLLPLLVMALVAIGFVVYLRRPAPGAGKALGFGKSRAQVLAPEACRVTFKDVAGIDEAEQELREIVEFLKEPAKFGKLGGKVPKGCLLVGPPGTGKTLLARAIAGEAGVPFFSMSGSAFVEMFVGVGASRVRDLFAQAKARAPCIVFIDEIDAVGRHRGGGLGGNDEREQTLNQLLVEMDGFDANEGVILIAATNRPDVLDPALLRPGRFDRQVVVQVPDIEGREQILKVHLGGSPTAPDIDIRVIARGTPGFSGADLANLVNEAALLAAHNGTEYITMADFEASRDKVLMGAERRSAGMTEGEKTITAYHEAGHALVALYSPGHDPLHKVTIIPRGRALGVTMSLPERDRYGFAKMELEAKIAMMFGGRVAEELTFGKEWITTGASDDIRQATDLARRMVTEFGFSEKLGPLRYADPDQGGFLGHGSGQRGNVSEATAQIIDEETRRIVEDGESSARRILTHHGDQLRRIAEALLDRETLSGEDVRALLVDQPQDRRPEVHRPA